MGSGNIVGNCCEVPCWSGLWLETEEIGYMEISDLDERTHRPPAGWHLVDVKENVFRSSQIFRYVPVPAKVRLNPLNWAPGALVAAAVSGAVTIGLPLIQGIIDHANHVGGIA